MKPEDSIFVVKDAAPIPIRGRGRPKGFGCNLRLLEKIKVGGHLWEVPKKKMNSIRESANKAGMKLRIRRLPDSDNYAIERLS